jgi:tetratricopeptide (TPR) repeat protein
MRTDKHRWGLLTLLMALMAVWWAVPITLHAHPAIEARLAHVNERIAADPRNGELYLKRGEIHRSHEDWAAALADYQRAEQLAPDLEVDFYRGRMWLDAGRLDLAQSTLDQFLRVKPNHFRALRVRARVLAQRGEPLAAADDLDKAITRFKTPMPDLYLEHARLLAAAGSAHIDRALRGLDEGIARFGPVVTLIQFAVDLESKQGQYDAALTYIDMLPARVKDSPLWVARRGDVLLAAGRPEDAKDTYAAALAAIERLPNQRRSARAVVTLENRLLLVVEQTPSR